MAIENERKYLLYDDKNELMPYLELLPEYQKWIVEQYYLFNDTNQMARIRCDEDLSKNEKIYFFAYKASRDTDLIEIEAEITVNEFDFLKLKAQRAPIKTRYQARIGENLWEFDYFEDCELRIAEVELPEGVLKPDVIPSIVQNYIMYEVEPGDWRFQNSNLATGSGYIEVMDFINHLREEKNVRIK